MGTLFVDNNRKLVALC